MRRRIWEKPVSQRLGAYCDVGPNYSLLQKLDAKFSLDLAPFIDLDSVRNCRIGAARQPLRQIWQEDSLETTFSSHLFW